MSYKYRTLKESQIIQREIEKQRPLAPKWGNKRNEQLSKADIKLAFFKDILSKSFPNDNTVWDKIEARKLALVKNGYWTIEGEITDLGYERLIKHLIGKERTPI
jgi:hypothetical protein